MKDGRAVKCEIGQQSRRQSIVVHIFMIYAPEVNGSSSFLSFWWFLSHILPSQIRDDYFPLHLPPKAETSSYFRGDKVINYHRGNVGTTMDGQPGT